MAFYFSNLILQTATVYLTGNSAHNQIHEGYYLSNLVLQKIGYHFGKIPDEIRNKIESSFCEGVIDTLFCTSTLMQGVNLPADNIIIDNKQNGRKIMSPIQFKNLTGRVGRLGSSMLGNVFLIAESDNNITKFKELVISDKLKAKLSLNTLIDRKIIKNVADCKI